MAREWSGNGTCCGLEGKRKKKFGGTFTRSVVSSYQEVYNHQARRLVEELKVHVGKPPFDSMHCIAHRTLETICQTGLGYTDFTDNIVTEEYYDAFNRSLELILLRGFNILYHCDWLYRLTSGYADMKKQVAVLNSVSETIIKKKLQRRQKEKNNKNTNEFVQEKKPSFKSFLDILLDLSENDPSLTEYQIMSEVNTLIVGGQETVAVTLFFAFLMLGSHPDVEEKLHAEVINILGDKPDVDKEDLSRMVYCEAVIFETLRMFPPIPTVLRYADRDLKLDSYTIPRGTTVVLNAWGSGRSESLWGNQASSFRPERWLYGEPCMSSCLAFSVGRRSCIETGLGYTDFTDNIVTQEYYDAFNRSLELILLRGFNILYHCDWLYRRTSGYADMKKQVAVLNSVSETIIKKKLQRRQKEKNNKNTNEFVQEKKPSFKSFLDILLDLSENDPSLTEYQIMSEVNTLIVGGQETVAVTLFFAFLMLGSHPDVEEKLHAEVINILGDKPDVDKEDLSRMVYCEAVIFETLRMFPPIPTVLRYADRDLKLDSYTIPRGTTVVLNAWGSGRSESLWGSQASSFRPERWLYGEPCMTSCLAFSVGRRSCIGRTYANAILKTMLAHCVRRFRFHSDTKKLKIKMDLVLRPISGHLLEVELRNDSR
ncbi:unnamed protein product [Danaus chrysippus]|uniref:(African queen) hypothetical protein n=1 Tax=Danaus chrysippus TaxID=151541 RepID=A0A8J2QTU5_9NEOP|nr:unnamed protein product [Danaus chrysippus]